MDGSWHDLKERFLTALGQSSEDLSPQWLTLWHLFLQHPWCQSQLLGCARKVLRKQHLPSHWLEDVKQEAMLLFAQHLQRAPDLHVDLERVEQHFESWLRTIIVRDCQQVVRSMVAANIHHSTLEDVQEDSVVNLRKEFSLEFNKAVQQLSDRQRIVILLVAKGDSWNEIAQQIGVTYRQVRYAYQMGIRRLKAILQADSDDGVE